jgi:hypothetical protein
MLHRTRKPDLDSGNNQAQMRLDLDALLHPAQAFAHPSDVLHDPDLTLSEKRAILASWASDACAVESAPDLRVNASGEVVRWDDIMNALRRLDKQAASAVPARFNAEVFWWPKRGLQRPLKRDIDKGARL